MPTVGAKRGTVTLGEIKANWSGSDRILERLMEIARASALAEMASGVAHELNQPLGAIATFAQAGERMLNRPDPMVNRALDVFRQINQAALRRRRLGAFSASGACFSKNYRRVRDASCPNSLLSCGPCLTSLRCAPRVSWCSVDVPGPVPDLLIDRLRIQHVLFALAQNAVDASTQVSDTPSIRIDVSADR